MSAIDVQVRFAAEFALFLVSIAGLGLSLLRSDLLVDRAIARVASGIGFAAMAGAALASGALIVDSPTAPAVVVLRFAAIVLLAASSGSWRPDRGGRELLRIGLAGLVIAEVLLAGDEASTLADAARIIGALAIGACLVGASARVISARIAASSALVLFAVITVVAVSLSSVASSNIEDEALRRYGARADTEASTISDQGAALLDSAKLLATALQTTSNSATLASLRRVTDTSRSLDARAQDAAAVTSVIDAFVQEFVADQDVRRGPTLLVDPAGSLMVATPTDTQDFLVELVGSAVIKDAIAGHNPTQSVVLVAGRLLAVATHPITISGSGFRGVVVRTSNLDTSYLAAELAPIGNEVAGVGMALVDRDGGVLSEAGARIDPTTLRGLATDVTDGSGDVDRAGDDSFVVARPIDDSKGTPLAAAIVLSAPRAQEDATREDLFRVLFLVAMGAAAAAFVLAALLGERIGSGLRKLTGAAAAIQAGNLDARAGVTTEDELGELGHSFDAMAASLHDLTANLRTAAIDEAELRGRLEAVFAGMGEALVAVDADGVITDFNAAAEELFDTTAREARGKVVGDIVQLRSEEGTNMARRLRRPVLEPWSESGTVRVPGGREVPVVVSAGALRSPSNEVTGAVFVLRDERRERELERMKTEFLSNISHELRTPLTPIKGFASILRTRDLPAAKARGFADEIATAADQLERVIGQLVNFATVVGGRLSIAAEPVAVRPMIDGILKPWRERLDDKHKLLRRVPTGLPRLMADPTYVGQALDELVDNAVKYSPDGGKIVVSADLIEGEDGPELEISVTDEGVGIPADRLETVLEDFAQADASATRRFGGLGLGLALVVRIARAHGGRFALTSTPGAGTHAVLQLPVDGPSRGRPR